MGMHVLIVHECVQEHMSVQALRCVWPTAGGTRWLGGEVFATSGSSIVTIGQYHPLLLPSSSPPPCSLFLGLEMMHEEKLNW